MRTHVKTLAWMILLLIISLASPAQACDVARGAYCGSPTATKAVVPHMADICYVADAPDKTVLLIYDKDSKLRRPNPQPVREAGTERTCFRIGPTWIDARTTLIVLCNGRYHVRIEGTALLALRAHGGMTPTEYACLKGKACTNYKEK